MYQKCHLMKSMSCKSRKKKVSAYGVLCSYRYKCFHFKEETIQLVINAVKQYGIEVFPQPTGEILVDMDDLIFYEVAMEKRDDDAYLVTGNQKHYLIRDFIVTPAEMMEIIERQ